MTQNEGYILSFKNAVYAKVENINDVSYPQLSRICSTYYKTAKDTTTQETTDKYLKFLRHLKKVGSYYTAIVNITICACNNDYKKLFSNMDVQRLDPIKTTQHISSWKKITQMFIPDQKGYEKFKEKCFGDYVTRSRLKKIFDDQLDEEINQDIYLHAELNILTKIVDQKYRSRTFVAVSKNVVTYAICISNLQGTKDIISSLLERIIRYTIGQIQGILPSGRKPNHIFVQNLILS